MADRTGSLLSRYSIAAALAAMAILFRQAFTPVWGDRLPFLTFFVAIFFSARLGGRGAGLLTTFLCALSAAYLWLPPIYSLRVQDLGSLVGLGVFILEGWAVSYFTEALHRARAQAEESASIATAERERFRITLASIGDAVIVTDPEGQVTFLNEAAESLTGWNQKEALGRPLGEVFMIVNELTRQPEENPVYQVLEKGKVAGLAKHTLLLSKDGTEKPIDDSGAPVRDEQGRVVGVVLVFRDVTERRKVEHLEQATQQQMRNLLESVNDGFFALDRDWRYRYLNQKAAEIARKSREQLLGQKIWDAFPDIVETIFYTEVQRSAAEQVPAHFEMYYEPYSAWFEFHTYPSPDGLSVFIQDTTARNQAERELSYLGAIVQSSDDVIIGKDLEGTILSWNASAERTYGYTAEEAIGRNVSFLVPPERSDELPQILQTLRQGRSINHYETERVRKDGKRINVALTISPIMDRRGRITGASTIARDITERKQAQFEREQLLTREQEARSQAEIANRAKDEFLATLSHELRTPLNAIFGWARLLRSGELDEVTSAHALEIIERNAAWQNQLIAGLLDVSRIITGKFHLEVRQVDLGPIIDETINTLRLAAEAKSIQLRVVRDAEAGRITGDAARLQQVLWNLVSNAIKFTPRGGEVQVRLECFDSDVEITVSDTGQGINPESLPFIFDHFIQADSSVIRRHGGLGLGLSIVRHLVELHGGSVQAENLEKGQGCAFRVKLPLRAIKTANGSASAASGFKPPDSAHSLEISPVLQGKRILVVDDDRDSCELFVLVLQQAGAQVRCTFSSLDALEVLQAWQPEVLLADIGMPGEDGYTLIRKVRSLALEQGRDIPAVALTAYAGTQDRTQALSAGFQAHLSKPVEPGELVATVRSLAEQAKKTERASPS